MSNRPAILIIDDEPQMRKLLDITLQSHDYQVLQAATGKQGITMAALHPPEAILLDLGLPDINGHQVLKELREWYSNPILILSVQNSEDDIIHALDNGANDYLTKPFRTGELLARLRSALRSRLLDQQTPLVQMGQLKIDLESRTVSNELGLIKFTATEFNLLALLARNRGKVLTHQYLLREIWGPGYIHQSQYLRVFIAQIRKKTEKDPNRPTYIITESGIGYRLTDPD
ncbi:MAG: response regulator [Chitinophagaceae bacterium]|nr:response regulator [Chitinophagaceae bacterium]